MCSLDLEDVWRKLHPNKKQFTSRTSDQKIKCRLDYWLTSKQLLQQSLARNCEINFAPHCDHSSVCMEIEKKVRQPRGPGFWKFNSSLLENGDYTATMAEKIPQFIDKYKDLEDKGLLWEMVKMEIRSFTITFTKTEAKNAETKKNSSLRDGPLEKFWGEGREIFEPQEFFSLPNSLYEFFLGQGMNIF